ncbi:MAG: metal ABC transporter ATP-binding protein [Gaiellaceae bacterium]
MPVSAELVRTEHLTAGYGGRLALEDVSFEVCGGERTAVLGPNGGGKSTLFRVLLGQLAPSAGRVALAGRCGFLPQTERSRLDYPVSALDVALMGTLSRTPWWRPVGRSERGAARLALARVGLAELTDTSFGDLSGGQRQRVLVARALVQDAPILLLDEPFTGVDQPSAEVLERLIAELAAEGRAILIATHDLEQARRRDRVLCLNRRQIAFGRAADVLTREVLEATYGGEIVVLGHGDHDDTAVLPAHHH